MAVIATNGAGWLGEQVQLEGDRGDKPRHFKGDLPGELCPGTTSGGTELLHGGDLLRCGPFCPVLESEPVVLTDLVPGPVGLLYCAGRLP